MSFMQPQIIESNWYEIDGPQGTEYVEVDLVDGYLQSWSEKYANMDKKPIPDFLASYCINKECYDIQCIHGFGARLSAPGYMDCTEFCVFDTAKDAAQYLLDTYYDFESEEDEENEISYLKSFSE